MIEKKVISKVNQKVIDFIKTEVAAKKEQHKKLMQSINPEMAKGLQKMKKIEC